jgi:transcriptional regulator with XRE-family HTH domain
MSDFGNNLRRLRKNRHMTLEELSQKLGINKSTLSRYESGQREPNHEAEENIADFFNVSLDELRGYKPIDFSIQNDAPEIQMTVNFMREMDRNTMRHLLAYAEYLHKMNGGDD